MPTRLQFSKGYRTIQVKSGKAYIRKASEGLRRCRCYHSNVMLGVHGWPRVAHP